MSGFDHQDWTPVVFRKKEDVKSKDALKHAQRTGNGKVETQTRDHNREQRDKMRKLEADLDPTADAPNVAPALPKLHANMRKVMSDARTKLGITREQLAQRVNVRPKVIVDLETGNVVQEAGILAKVGRVLGVHLRFGA